MPSSPSIKGIQADLEQQFSGSWNKTWLETIGSGMFKQELKANVFMPSLNLSSWIASMLHQIPF